MNPIKVDRARVHTLEDLPNIGKACAADLRLIGITAPAMLVGRDPYELYDLLCVATAMRQDPCMIDVLVSVVRFMDGEPPQPWWAYTAERKAREAARHHQSAR
ncbi:helix-hairpin-helix domain-containing protein [Jeongeupia naejangsanensis]|uniref:Helix-hairpin-helix domain-containing protein n=1 Tax=Jeongeupia naejangsanensis TaxID=613195 RepID=A0ABS2BI16_9NEIS|nr:helix-hairpin-helix domain-containing protein [Jeongeupia naejangsanensis]MBM3115258.1 helix-hairpin-helix domain-containing protein [Jeongeupia naejangsanensis]